jgi:hypothetical protein
MTKNEKVAQEGAAIWTAMNPEERSDWVAVSMTDFERRVVAWKEKEVIEAMIQSGAVRDSRQGETSTVSAPNIVLDDDAHISASRTRINQLNQVESRPKKVSTANGGGNPILLELLNDARFRPLPLVDTTRAQEDLSQGVEKNKVAVQQFIVQGPIETSLGDDCMGCTRGWSHFCAVLKRPIPSSEHRAKLQPPVSSLTATRIGLGLKVNLPYEDKEGLDAEKQKRSTNAAADVGLANICPNYQPRDGFSLSTPSLRLDDTTAFIECAATMLSMKPDSASIIIETESASPGRSKPLARGLLPLRGRKKNASIETSSSVRRDGGSLTLEDSGKKQHYKCGHCGTTQSSPFGCMPCRKSHLVSQMANRSFCSPHSVADEFLKKSSSVESPN